MTNIANTYNLEGVYIGPAPATGNHFMLDSGVFASYQMPINSVVDGNITYWPDIGIGNHIYSRSTAFSGIEFSGKKNVIRIVPDTTSGFHGMFVRFPSVGSGAVSSGLYRVEADIYLPPENTIIRSISIVKNGVGFNNIFNVSGVWQRFERTVFCSVLDNSPGADNFGILAYSGNSASIAQFSSNGTDVIYFKDLKVINVSGFNYINLIQPLERVQSVNYSFDIPRQNITQIGSKYTAAISPIEAPIVNLEISTIQNILANENKIGFNVNYPNFFSGNNGNSIYNGFNYDILSRFTSIEYTGMSGLFYPQRYADKRNIFVSMSSGNREREVENDNFNNPTYGFGNCYLSKYSWAVSINSLPVTKFNYVCENAQFYNRNNGQLPSLISRTASNPPGRAFIIPNYSGSNNNIAAALPIDTVITINNTGYGGMVDSENIGVRISDFKIQGASFELNLERRNLDSIGFQLPVNRKINYPVFVNLSVDAIVGNEYVGSINNIFKSDSPYDINIKLNNKCLQTGAESYKNTLIQYDFKSAYLNNISYNSQVGGFKTVSFNFIQEMNPENGIGLFMSGLVYGRTLQTTGTTNNLCFRPIEFIHRSGNLTYYNSII